MFANLKYSGTFPLPYTACVAHVLSETNLIGSICLVQTVKRTFLLACRRTYIVVLDYICIAQSSCVFNLPVVYL